MNSRVNPAPGVGAVLASLQGDDGAPGPVPVQAVIAEPELTSAPELMSVPDLAPGPAAIPAPAMARVAARPPVEVIDAASPAPALDGLSVRVVADLLASAAVQAQSMLDQATAERDVILAQARAEADAYVAARVLRLGELRDGLSELIDDLNANGQR